jgi:hypothetical protein
MPSRLARCRSATLLALVVLPLAGCTASRLAVARDDYIRKELSTWVYPQNCNTLWPDVLRLLAAEGFALVGADRAVAGQQAESGIATFFSKGFQTRQSYDGGLVVATDWSRDWVRYRAEGTVVGSGCNVRFTRDSQPDVDDPGQLVSSTDWDMALALLRRVDPAGAARVEAGIPKTAP